MADLLIEPLCEDDKIGHRIDSIKCFSKTVGRSHEFEFIPHVKHQNDVVDQKQTISFLDQEIPLQSQLLSQYGDLQKILPLDRSNSKLENDKQNTEKYAKLSQEDHLKQNQNNQNYLLLCDLFKENNTDGVVFKAENKTDHAIFSDGTRLRNINNSSLGDKASASKLGNQAPMNIPGSGPSYGNIPFSGGSVLPPSVPNHPPPGHLLLGPDQVDMLLALAVSNYSGTDMIGCCKCALQSSDARNILRNYLVAVKYRLYDVMCKLLDIIRRNFLCIAQTQEFLSLPLEFVLVFMEDSCLNVQNELDMFVIALSWIDYNKQERIPQAAGQILKCVRYVHIEPADIAQYVEPNLHLFTGICGAQALINLYKHHVYRKSNQPPAGFDDQIPPKRGMPPRPDTTHIVSDKFKPTYGPQDRPYAQGTSNPNPGSNVTTNSNTLGSQNANDMMTRPGGAFRNSPTSNQMARSLSKSETKPSSTSMSSALSTGRPRSPKEKVQFKSTPFLEQKRSYTPEGSSSTEIPNQNKNANFSCLVDQPDNTALFDIIPASNHEASSLNTATEFSRACSVSQMIFSPNNARGINFASVNRFHDYYQKVVYPDCKSRPLPDQQFIKPLPPMNVPSPWCPNPHYVLSKTGSAPEQPHTDSKEIKQNDTATSKESMQRVFVINRAMSGPIITYPKKE